MKRIIASGVVLLASLSLAACGGSNADTVNDNLGKEAEQFKIVRRIVVTNNITDKVLYDITGRCSLESNPHLTANLEIICKDDGENGKPLYKKHFIGLADNLSWASTQLEGVNVSEYRTKFIFRPEAIIPDIDLATGDGS